MTVDDMTRVTRVQRVNDDRECPSIGRVIGWEDEERCLVLWGDAQYSDDPMRARVEYADELIPVRQSR